MSLITIIKIASFATVLSSLFIYLFTSFTKHLGHLKRREDRLDNIGQGRSKDYRSDDNTTRSIIGRVVSFAASVGTKILKTGLLNKKTLAELEQSIAPVAGSRTNAMSIFIGTKAIFTAFGLTFAWFLFENTHPGTIWHSVVPLVIPVAGLLLPDYIVRKLHSQYLEQVSKGIADALDLLVICAESGLPIEASIGRVALEMRAVNKAVANEFRITADEMAIFTDRREVLINFGKRTNIDYVKRIASALNQTMLAGSSISQALRVLSAEMRQDMLTQYEAKAAQLPALLTLPMILFIMPVVFIVAGGPAVLRAADIFHH